MMPKNEDQLAQLIAITVQNTPSNRKNKDIKSDYSKVTFIANLDLFEKYKIDFLELIQLAETDKVKFLNKYALLSSQCSDGDSRLESMILTILSHLLVQVVGLRNAHNFGIQLYKLI